MHRRTGFTLIELLVNAITCNGSTPCNENVKRKLWTFAAVGMVVGGRLLAEDGSNRPAEAGEVPAQPDSVLEQMERAAAPATVAAFKAAHPAPFRLFGEDRQRAVRNNIVPAHWFGNGGPGERFEGVARPGEFYVFQTCVLSDSARELAWEVRANAEGEPLKAAVCVTPAVCRVGAGGLKPLWAGLRVPQDAAGKTLAGTVTVRDRQSGESRSLAFRVPVRGVPLEASGVDDAWRLARLQWLDSTVGQSDQEATRPFTPVGVDGKKRTLSVLGREIRLTGQGLPAQITSRFSASNTRTDAPGRGLLAGESALNCVVGGVTQVWRNAVLTQTGSRPVYATWQADAETGDLRLRVKGRLEYDGYLALEMSLSAKQGTVAVDRVSFDLPVAEEAARYAMGLGRTGGLFPESYAWKWDVSKQQDALWFGDVNIGMMMRLKGGNYERPLVNAYYAYKTLKLPDSWGSGGVELSRDAAHASVSAWSGPQLLTEKPLVYAVDMYLTPFKPLAVKAHLSDRYYHGFPGSSPVEKLAEVKAGGANIVTLHQNTVQNPYINYPYNSDSLGLLKQAVKAAHAQGTRLKIYYTTRELTQNLPEFFALKSLDGEILMPRDPAVKQWPITNSNGPHPWLQAHVGMDIVPAWKETIRFKEYPERLDLAVLTTPDSRWNNFYLAGLDYLVRKVGIDGVYIDDTALDRVSMRRARRILDADGNTGRRVDMHSWNHFNGMAGFASSSVVFMELYPYYDSLWHGEEFSYDTPPEYWLTEISGIPFGLMSEMLQGGGNPWRGMVFGMTQRWPWSGDPRNVWKIMDLFGIMDSELIGWWDPACPVKTGHPQVKASVYRKPGKALIALASWDAKKANVSLTVDWKALGLDPRKTTLWAPASAGFQEERVFPAAGTVPVVPGKGWLLIADETPRESTPDSTEKQQ